MKCAKCGAELKKGCLYCSVCGHEAQMVNEFSVIEEDYLKSILAEGPKEKDTAAGQTGASSDLDPSFYCSTCPYRGMYLHPVVY